MESPFQQADTLIRQTGARVTEARVKVLAFLLVQDAAVTHQQIESAWLPDEPIDRVTLYRTLDWLVEQQLAHKVVSADRVWHYRANLNEASHRRHAHFRCNSCDKLVCLGELPQESKMLPLPKGYRRMEVEVTVKGLCKECA